MSGSILISLKTRHFLMHAVLKGILSPEINNLVFYLKIEGKFGEEGPLDDFAPYLFVLVMMSQRLTVKILDLSYI